MQSEMISAYTWYKIYHLTITALLHDHVKYENVIILWKLELFYFSLRFNGHEQQPCIS